MAVFDLYSKRKKRQALQGQADVYQYDEIPQPLKIQIIRIWRSTFGRWFVNSSPFSHLRESPSSKLWQQLHDIIAKENGIWHLGKSESNPEQRCAQYLLTASTEGALDIIELSFKVIDQVVRNFGSQACEDADISQDPDDAIEELNQRFREHGVGYQYLKGEIVKVDSQFLHAETVKPALALLHAAGFSGPADEFIRAFDHHRKG